MLHHALTGHIHHVEIQPVSDKNNKFLFPFTLNSCKITHYLPLRSGCPINLVREGVIFLQVLTTALTTVAAIASFTRRRWTRNRGNYRKYPNTHRKKANTFGKRPGRSTCSKVSGKGEKNMEFPDLGKNCALETCKQLGKYAKTSGNCMWKRSLAVRVFFPGDFQTFFPWNVMLARKYFGE